MSDNTENGNVIELTTRDQQILNLKVAGISTKRIAKELQIKDFEVTTALDRALPQVDAAYRGRVLRLELERLEQLGSFWFAQARTSISAAGLCLKISERRAQLLGLDAPQHVRLDPVQIVAGAGPQESSTELLLRELHRIAAEPQPAELVAESEAERAAGRKAEAPAEPPDPAA